MGKFVIRRVPSGLKFDLKAGNGQIVLTSEVYTTDAACRKGIESVTKNAPLARIENQTEEGWTVQKHPKFEVYLDKKGAYRFRLKARNGEIIAVSDSYSAKAGCLGGIESVKNNAPDAVIVEE
ncbi:MAG: YegP family protein [Oscillospiraceae bacterium]|nr:YegP family protein [Oscillospiraceae bacterium]